MPAADPTDQQSARALEFSLREAVDRLERPPVELEWFMALPKRTRRSAQLIEMAQADSRVLLEHVRSEWNRMRRTQQEHKDQMAKARAQPRNLECLRAPDPAAWNGLGRRKRRCRTFEAIGRAYNTRQQPLDGLSKPAAPAVDIHSLHPSTFLAPTRPPTPLGLRTFVRNVPGLLHWASGPADATQYGLPTPPSPSPPPSPPSPSPLAVVLPPPDFPLAPQPGEFRVQGCEIDPDMAYVVAHGRHSHCPREGYSAQEAAIDVHRAEVCFPGALEYLAKLLFPAGVGQYRQMVDSAGMEPLVDFMHGWFDLSERARAAC